MKYHTANLDAGYVWAIVQEQVEAHTAQFPDRVGAIGADDVGGTGLFLLRCCNVDCLQSSEVILLEDVDEQ